VNEGSSEPSEQEEKPSKFKPLYAYLVMSIILMIRVATQWQQKSIGFFYGYRGVAD
jgi:hypothetical protein